MHANDVVLLNNFQNQWKDNAPQGLADDACSSYSRWNKFSRTGGFPQMSFSLG